MFDRGRRNDAFSCHMPAITTLPMMPKSIGGQRWKRSQRMGYLCLSLVLSHLAFFWLKGWLGPAKWLLGLPSISLWAAAATAIPLVVKLWSLLERRTATD